MQQTEIAPTTGVRRTASVRSLAEAAIFADFMLVLMFVQHILTAYALVMPMFAPLAVIVMARRNGARAAATMVLASVILTAIFVSPFTAITAFFYALTGLALGLAPRNGPGQTGALLAAWVINLLGAASLILVNLVFSGENIFDFHKVINDNWLPGRFFGAWAAFAFVGFYLVLELALAFGARWLARKLLARM